MGVQPALAEHACAEVVPLVVHQRARAKRHHHELGQLASQVPRLFDDLRLHHGAVDTAFDSAGTWAVRRTSNSNHTDPAVLPAAFANFDSATTRGS